MLLSRKRAKDRPCEVHVVSGNWTLKFEAHVDLCRVVTGVCVPCGSSQWEINNNNINGYDADCVDGGAIADLLRCRVKLNGLVLSEIEVFGKGKLRSSVFFTIFNICNLIFFLEIVEGEVHRINIHRGSIVDDSNNHQSDAIALDKVFSQNPKNCSAVSNSGEHEISLEIPWALVTHIRVLSTAKEAGKFIRRSGFRQKDRKKFN